MRKKHVFLLLPVFLGVSILVWVARPSNGSVPGIEENLPAIPSSREGRELTGIPTAERRLVELLRERLADSEPTRKSRRVFLSENRWPDEPDWHFELRQKRIEMWRQLVASLEMTPEQERDMLSVLADIHMILDEIRAQRKELAEKHLPYGIPRTEGDRPLPQEVRAQLDNLDPDAIGDDLVTDVLKEEAKKILRQEQYEKWQQWPTWGFVGFDWIDVR